MSRIYWGISATGMMGRRKQRIDDICLIDENTWEKY